MSQETKTTLFSHRYPKTLCPDFCLFEFGVCVGDAARILERQLPQFAVFEKNLRVRLVEVCVGCRSRREGIKVLFQRRNLSEKKSKHPHFKRARGDLVLLPFVDELESFVFLNQLHPLIVECCVVRRHLTDL